SGDHGCDVYRDFLLAPAFVVGGRHDGAAFRRIGLSAPARPRGVMNFKSLLEVVLVFVPLSFLTVGGGQSIVADIHRQAVEVYGWVDNAEFMDLYAWSSIIPGPGALLVTLVGCQAAGLAGSLVASAAIFIPSSLLVYGLAHLWTRFKEKRYI